MLLAVAVGCLVFQFVLPSRDVAEADFRAAAQVLETQGQSGDVVLLVPWWSEKARVFLPERFPIVGYMGSNLDPLELHPRIWVLTQPRNADGYTTTNTAVGAAQKFGNLSLQLYQNSKYRPARWDARDALAGAKVFLESAEGARSDCQWDGRAHRCPNGGEVAVEWHEVKFQPRRCIRFWPPGGGSKLVAEFEGVPAAGSIALRAGITWDRGYFHSADLTPVDIGVQLNGDAASALTIPVGVEGLLASEGPPVPAGASVRVWSRSANPLARELCVELYALEKAP